MKGPNVEPREEQAMNTQVSPSSLVTSIEAADRLGCSERMVRKLVQTRQVPFVRVGRLVRFRPEDLDRYVEAHTVTTASDGHGVVL